MGKTHFLFYQNFFKIYSDVFDFGFQSGSRLASKLGFGIGSDSGLKNRVRIGLNIFGPLTTLKSHYYEERELLQANPLSSNCLILTYYPKRKEKSFHGNLSW